jgi:DNA-binding NarL/FixJ family response regulator
MFKYRVAIVDDHLLYRKSMTLLVNSFEGIHVIVDAENGQDFLDLLEDNLIDVVLLDIQMPVLDGYQTCKKLQENYPDLKILIVSQLSTRESIHRIMELGAHGYFTKNSNPEQLETAIKSVVEKGFYFGLELSSVVKEAMFWQQNNPNTLEEEEISTLSLRELQIVKLICSEKRSKEIADELFINVRTVEAHRKNIMDKTKTKNFIGVLLYALKNEILTIEELI